MTDEPDVEVGDDTPKLEEQARLNGWRAGVFDFGKAEEPGVEYFNPGCVRRPDGLWLLVRRSQLVDGMPYGKNAIWACKLKGDKTPEGGPLLEFPESQTEEQFEDPRAVYWNGQTWLGCVNFTWFPDGTWTGAHQCLGIFRDDWSPIARRDPPVETNCGEAGFTNGHHQKNWLWFFHEDKLHLIYTSDPWKVIEFGSKWEEQTPYASEGVKWKYGQIRGGTPPVRVGDLYWTFFHSSLPWRGRFRRYFMGALAFEAKPPFKPVFVTPEPLLTGSQNDKWHQRKPLVVFPCGAVLENDRWFVTFGINDLSSGWAEIPHEDVVKLAQPKPLAPGVALLQERTPRPVYEHVAPKLEGGDATSSRQPSETLDSNAAPTSNPLGAAITPAQQRMAKARETLAAKRAAGLVTNKPRRKRNRKELKQDGKARSIKPTCQPSQK